MAEPIGVASERFALSAFAVKSSLSLSSDKELLK